MIGCPQCEMSRRSAVRAGLAGLGAITGGVLASGALSNSAAAEATQPHASGGPIDFHTHMFDPDLPNLITGAMTSTHVAAWLEGMKSPEVQIAHMDRYGVGSHVVGYSNATHGITWGMPRMT